MNKEDLDTSIYIQMTYLIQDYSDFSKTKNVKRQEYFLKSLNYHCKKIIELIEHNKMNDKYITLNDWLKDNNYDVHKDFVIELEEIRIKSDMVDMGLQYGDCSDEYINALLKDIKRSRKKINKIKEKYLKDSPDADWEKEIENVKKEIK